MQSQDIRRLAAAALLAAAAGACSRAEADAGGDPSDVRPEPQLVLARATEYAFDAPDTVRAGMTRVRLENAGQGVHHMQLLRLDEGRTMDELRARITAGELVPSWTTAVGGPGVPESGAATEVTLDLEPGRYALVCYIPTGGKRHLELGMLREMVVVPSEAPRAAEPVAGVRMVLDDYSFAVTPAITAGRHTIRVENAAAQPHEVEIVRVAPGKRFEDVLAWAQAPRAGPPFVSLGGTVALARGQVNYVTLDLAPGDYALLCFVPDAKDGRPHVAHGMIRHLRVE